MKSSIALLILILSATTTLRAQLFIDAESGVAFTGYNNIRIPGDAGTTFSFSKDLNADPKIFYRIRAGYTFLKRHTISGLYAPLEIRSTGAVPFDIMFNGDVFTSNARLEGLYKFNSYRLTYRYDLVHKPRFEFGIGFTAKIRDAAISLATGSEFSEKTNVGFVPVINFRLAWKANDQWGLLLEGDALAAPQGRAEDVLLAGIWNVSDQLRIRAGYRLLEGGADNDEVYNFTLVNYASAGFTLDF